MDDKITIIEGPPPTFEAIPDLWVHGLVESITQSNIVATRLRTFNGPDLIERCHRTWREQGTISLEYRNSDGLEAEIPIVAARLMETDEGSMILLWLRRVEEDVELEFGYDDDLDDGSDWGLDGTL
jgi:hypothetical protein